MYHLNKLDPLPLRQNPRVADTSNNWKMPPKLILIWEWTTCIKIGACQTYIKTIHRKVVDTECPQPFQTSKHHLTSLKPKPQPSWPWPIVPSSGCYKRCPPPIISSSSPTQWSYDSTLSLHATLFALPQVTFIWGSRKIFDFQNNSYWVVFCFIPE